jgi:transcriptional regulator with XRE-family HTH domain
MKSPVAKRLTPADRWVGSKIRIRRNTLGMSQAELGEGIGVSFQQVQKYEKGVNRVGAGRLQQIAKILQMPVEWFFQGMPQAGRRGAEPIETEEMAHLDRFIQSRYAPALIRAFVQMPDKLQRGFARLISQIADAGASTVRGP